MFPIKTIDLMFKLAAKQSSRNAPTNPGLWSQAISEAKKRFTVYPSAYANGWAAKWYKERGGGWEKEKVALNVMGGEPVRKQLKSGRAVEPAHYHGSPHKLTHLRAGSWVTPHRDDAAVFGVPWGSKDLIDLGGADGRPPQKLNFKGTPPKDHPVYVYAVDVPVVKAKTNTGKEYDWNRQITEETPVRLVKTIESWHDQFLEGRKRRHPVGLGSGRQLARGKKTKKAEAVAKKDVGHGGLDEWFSGHGKDKGKAQWGDWVSISPVRKQLKSGRVVEPGDIVGACGISDSPDWQQYTKGGQDPLKCMPRKKALAMSKEQRAALARGKARAERSSSNTGKPVMTPTFSGKGG